MRRDRTMIGFEDGIEAMDGERRMAEDSASGPAGTHIDFEGFARDLEERRAALGLTGNEAETDALRNKGHGRTESKRALLRAIAERCRAEGVEPPIAYIDGERI